MKKYKFETINNFYSFYKWNNVSFRSKWSVTAIHGIGQITIEGNNAKVSYAEAKTTGVLIEQHDLVVTKSCHGSFIFKSCKNNYNLK